MEIGSVLAGKYRVDRILGQGGMGIVVQAMHLQLGTPVAVKFLLPEVLHNQDVVQRFLREAQAAVRLRSEHVARVIDVGALENGAPYMVLEYLEGTDLSAFPRTQLDVGLIVDLILQSCEALAEAHSLGIVHRDIKPANFFITRRADGSLLLKILDFGISKSGVAQDHKMTGTQVVMGTPAYMSPEQMKSSRQVDNRSDIWSLGVVLYELLEGRSPYEAETFTSLAIKVATEPLRPLTVRLPQGLPEIVYRCLEKEPSRRTRDVAELARALAPYARSQTQAAITVDRTGRLAMPMGQQATMAQEGPRPPSTLSAAAAEVNQTAPGAKKKRWPIFAGVGVAAGAAALVFVVATQGSTPPAPSADHAASAPAAASPPPTPTATPPATAPAVAVQPTPAPTPPAPTPPVVTPQVVTPPVVTPPAPTPPVTTTTATAKAKPTTKKPKPTTTAKPATTKPATTTTAQPPDDILGTRN